MHVVSSVNACCTSDCCAFSLCSGKTTQTNKNLATTLKKTSTKSRTPQKTRKVNKTEAAPLGLGRPTRACEWRSNQQSATIAKTKPAAAAALADPGSRVTISMVSVCLSQSHEQKFFTKLPGANILHHCSNVRLCFLVLAIDTVQQATGNSNRVPAPVSN